MLRFASLCAGVVMLSASRAHPIHAARLEIDAPGVGAITAVLHVYRDDFPAAVDLAAVTVYLNRVLALSDARGLRVVLRATAVASEGDRLRIDLSGVTAGAISHGRIAVTLLQDRYPDQVNVVDARIGGHRAQLLFLRGDPAQVLP